MRNDRKLVHALIHNHPHVVRRKLHPHFTKINFPPQANNKVVEIEGIEARILNLGPKFVPPAPQQVLKRLPKEIKQMKEKVAAAWRSATKTVTREPLIVERFCQRIEDEVKKNYVGRNNKESYNNTGHKVLKKNAAKKGNHY